MSSVPSLPNENPVTSAGKRFLSSALASEMLREFAKLAHEATEVNLVMGIVTCALRGEPVDCPEEFEKYARSAIQSRDLVEKLLVECHLDMVRLGTPPALCERKLIYALKHLRKIAIANAEVLFTVKH
jgi:hypothetical protein